MNEGMDRIIGDFLEINADITKWQFESKLPKFVAKFMANCKRKSLLKRVKRLSESGYVLNINNLIEFITYLYNNYPPKGKYGSIYQSKIVDDIEPHAIEAVFHHDVVTAVITIYGKESGMDINIQHKVSQATSNTYSLSRESLIGDESTVGRLIKTMNEILLIDICEYIAEIITGYIKRKD